MPIPAFLLYVTTIVTAQLLGYQQYQSSGSYLSTWLVVMILISSSILLFVFRRLRKYQETSNVLAVKLQQSMVSEKYFKTLIEIGSDAIALVNKEGKVIYQTPLAENITGYSLEELKRLDGLELIHPNDRQEDYQKFQEFVNTPGAVINRKHRFRHKNGYYIWLGGTYRNLLHDDTIKAIVYIYSDITENQLIEEKLNKYNKELTLLNRVNDIILRIQDESKLYIAICECIAQTDGFKLAWICKKPLPDADQTIVPLAAAGATGYVKEINISLNDPVSLKGPTATVLVTGETFVNNDLVNAPLFKPWQETAVKYGIYSSIALPLNFSDGSNGALTIYSMADNAFDKREVSIMERISINLSLAVSNIRIRCEKEYTKELLQQKIRDLTSIYKADKILQAEELNIDQKFSEISHNLIAEWRHPYVRSIKICHNNKIYADPIYERVHCKKITEFNLLDGTKGVFEILYNHDEKAHDKLLFKEVFDFLNSIAKSVEVYLNKDLQQKALIKSEDRFRGAFESAIIGMAVVSLDGKYLMVNNALCSMLGYTKSELFKLTFQQLTHPEDLSKDMVFYRQFLLGGRDFYHTEKRYLHKNGSAVWINVNVSIIRDDSANPLYFVSQLIDITEKKEIYTDLEKSEANLRSIFDTTKVSYLLLDTDYNVVTLNQHMHNVYMELVNVDLMPGINIIDVVPLSKREGVLNVYNEVVKTNRPIEYETMYIVEQRPKYYLANVAPIIEQEKVTGLCITSIDITSRKLLEVSLENNNKILADLNKNLEKKARDLEAANKELELSETLVRNYAQQLSTIVEDERSRIAREIHDEFGQQLFGLRVQLSSLKKVKDVPQNCVTTIDELVLDVKNGMGILRRIVNDLRPAIIDKLGLLPAIEWLIEGFEKKTGIRCELNMDAERPEISKMEAINIFRIFQEALTNIVKHANASVVKVDVKNTNGILEFIISDDGKGFCADRRQAPLSFGLQSMKERAHLAQAEMTIDTATGAGTTIKLIIDTNAKKNTDRR